MNKYHPPTEKSNNNCDWPEYVELLLLEHRQLPTRNNIKSFLNLLFSKTYKGNSRWVEIHNKASHALLGGKYPSILDWMLRKHWIESDDHYITNLKSKSYILTDSFLKLWIEKPRGENNSGKQTQCLMSLQSLQSFSIMNPPSQCRFGFDLEALKELLPTVYPSLFNGLYKRSEVIGFHVQLNILYYLLGGQFNEVVSEKNHRHYDNVTMLQRDIRACLTLDGKKYVGDVDLKCSAGLISIGMFQDQIPENEMQFLENMLRSPDTWIILGKEAGVKTKDQTKSLWNTFLMGQIEHNKWNSINRYMKKHVPVFVALLDIYKSLHNISNETNKIEASILHSEGLKKLLAGQSYHIIHDGVMFFGETLDVDVMRKVAKYILDGFFREHGMKMSITVEVRGLEKEIMTKNIKDEVTMTHRGIPIIIREINVAGSIRERYFIDEPGFSNYGDNGWISLEQMLREHERWRLTHKTSPKGQQPLP